MQDAWYKPLWIRAQSAEPQTESKLKQKALLARYVERGFEKQGQERGSDEEEPGGTS